MSPERIGFYRRQKIESLKFCQEVVKSTAFELLHEMFNMTIVGIPEGVSLRVPLVTVYLYLFCPVLVAVELSHLLAYFHSKVASR